VQARVAGVVAVGALTVAGTALADGSFFVIPNDTRLAHSTGTALDFTLPSETASPAQITIYVPTGYVANLDRASGDVATVDATLDAHGTELERHGSLIAVDPGDFVSNACAPGRHAAVWLLRLFLGSRTFDVPVYVDPTSETDATLGAYRLQMCFGSTELPESQGGATLGARLTGAYMYFPSTFTNPLAADVYAWHMLVSTYIPGTSTVNPAVVELRALASFPSSLSLRVRYNAAKHAFTLSGRYLAGTRTPAGSPVLIFAGKSRNTGSMGLAGVTRTKAGGKYTARVKTTHRLYFIAYVWPRLSSDCTFPGSAASAGCVSESESPTFSSVVKGTPKRR
jgi:hypothetical protein